MKLIQEPMSPVMRANCFDSLANYFFEIRDPEVSEVAGWVVVGVPADTDPSISAIRNISEKDFVLAIIAGTAHKKFSLQPDYKLACFVKNKDASWTRIALCVFGADPEDAKEEEAGGLPQGDDPAVAAPDGEQPGLPGSADPSPPESLDLEGATPREKAGGMSESARQLGMPANPTQENQPKQDSEEEGTEQASAETTSKGESGKTTDGSEGDERSSA